MQRQHQAPGRTTTLPAEYCDACLLRAALLKSYSGRISSAPTGATSTRLTVLDLVVSFFIIPFLPSSCFSRTDHANLTIPLRIHDCQQTLFLRNTQQHQSFFCHRVTRVSHYLSEGIDKLRTISLRLPSTPILFPRPSDRLQKLAMLRSRLDPRGRARLSIDVCQFRCEGHISLGKFPCEKNNDA